MKLAAAQIACEVGDVAANVRKMSDFAKRAKSAGADWVVFPEMSDTGYVMSVIREKASRWNEGPVLELQRTAAELSLGIICGISERTDECIFNSLAVIAPSGEVIGKYRKTHLFSPSPVEEHKCFAAGGELVALTLGSARVGLSICYDLRFPEFYRALAVNRQASVLVVSAAWPFPRLEHLRTLAVARAIENQCYVIVSNRVGKDGSLTCCGTSAIVDPYGVVIAAASADREELILGEISDEVLRAVRERMAVFEHRRPEIYAP